MLRPGAAGPCRRPGARAALGAALLGLRGRPTGTRPPGRGRGRGRRPGAGAGAGAGASSGSVQAPGDPEALEDVPWDGWYEIFGPAEGERPPSAALLQNDEDWKRFQAERLAEALRLPEDEARRRVESLITLLPDMERTILHMDMGQLTPLVANLDRLGKRLVQLRLKFLRSNLPSLIAANRYLLTEEWAACEAKIDAAVELLGYGSVAELEQQSDLLRDAPGVLDVGALEEVLGDMREQFVTGPDVEREFQESYVAAMLPEKLREGRRQQQWRKQGEEPMAENLEVKRTRDRHMR